MKADTLTLHRRHVLASLMSLGLSLVATTIIGCQRAQAPDNAGASLQEEKTLAQLSPEEESISPPSAEPEVDEQARFERLIATSPKMSIEIVEPGKFKIDGNGPFTGEEARAEAVRVTTGKKLILVHLISSREAVADDEYKAFKESLHRDGGMLVGLDIAGLGEER